MARLLTQTLTLARPASSPSTTAASVSLRGLATKVEIIEIDLTEEDASSSAHGSSPSSPSVEVVGIRRLEEAIHGVMVRRAAPDWLPFVPGGSFWVPPLRRPHGVAELVGRIAAAGGSDGVAELVGGIAAAEGTEGVAGAVSGAVEVVELDAPMTEEQALCFSTTRGWPSSSFFVEDVLEDYCCVLALLCIYGCCLLAVTPSTHQISFRWRLDNARNVVEEWETRGLWDREMGILPIQSQWERWV